MANKKPILGYESRIAAAVALNSQGLSARAIGETLGLEAHRVTTRIRESREWKRENCRITVRKATLHALQPHATRRNMHPADLASLIVDIVADCGLVDAVLDDQPETSRQATAPRGVNA